MKEKGEVGVVVMKLRNEVVEVGVNEKKDDLRRDGSKRRRDNINSFSKTRLSQDGLCAGTTQTQIDVVIKHAQWFGNGVRLGCHYRV